MQMYNTDFIDHVCVCVWFMTCMMCRGLSDVCLNSSQFLNISIETTTKLLQNDIPKTQQHVQEHQSLH